EDLGAGLFRGAGRGEAIERLNRQLQIRNSFGFEAPLVDTHEVQRGPVGPSKFLIEPGEPIAVAYDLLALDEVSADFDHIADGPLAEPADLRDVLIKNGVFQEGDDPEVTKIFAEIARLTGGATAKFNAGAAQRLADLLKAVVAFATGGMKALAAQDNA